MEALLAVAVIQLCATVAALWLSGRRWLAGSSLRYLVSVAVGVLLSTALLHILPEGVAALGNRSGLWLVFLGTVFALFCIERLFAALTGHSIETPSQGEPDCGEHHHHHGSRPLSLIFGGMLHSVVDGVSVAAAFTAGRRTGWLTAAAITLHEVPHRLGDYALLTHLQVPRPRALRMLLFIAGAALAGVALVEFAGHTLTTTNWLLPMSAASFVYIGLVSLMPELMGEDNPATVVAQLLAMLAGAALVALLLRLPGA